MGQKQSSSISVINNVMNQSFLNIVQKNLSSADAKVNAVNTFKVKVGKGAKVIGCDFQLGQSIKSEQNVSIEAKSETKTDLIQKMTAAVDNTFSQASSQVTGFLAPAFGSQASRTDMRNNIINTINTNINDETVNEINAELQNLNRGDFIIDGEWSCGKDGKVVINQEIVNKQVAQIYTTKLIETLMKNENIANAVNKAKQESSQEAKGIDSIFSGAFMMIALIVIVIFGVVGFVIYKVLMSPAGQSGLSAVASKASGGPLGKLG